MRTLNHRWGDYYATIYYLDKGEKVAKHAHAHEHTTAVICGRSRVDIYRNPPQVLTMKVGDDDVMLPASIAHEITALDDGTIIINVTKEIPLPPDTPGHVQAGVTLVDS